jgi:hypothetical protein
MDSRTSIRRWTDREIMVELERNTGDGDRNVEREEVQRLMQMMSSLSEEKSKRR